MRAVKRHAASVEPAKRRAPTVYVSALSPASTRGHVRLGICLYPCALGRTGRRARKREGDGATPVGRWAFRDVFYRPDRVRHPRTGLAVRALEPAQGWCDAPSDRNYNRPVRHPYAASAERLWRGDELYDLVIVLDYNLRPRVKGLGSAIFMHLARPGYRPTEGCIALSRPHLEHLLARLARGAAVRIL